jgi:hypothetical protein
MKKLLNAISLWGYSYQRSEKELAYLVVDMDYVGTFNGSLSHFEAFKTNEFETEEAARKHIEEDVALSHRRYIRLYKRISV